MPKRLGVLGGGSIGLEFAGLYNRLGSQVTVLDAATSFFATCEPSIAKLAKEYMEEDGIVFEQGVKTSKLRMTVMKLSLLLIKVSFVLMLSSMRQDASLILNLFTWKIPILLLTERGGIQVNKHLETSLSGVFAVVMLMVVSNSLTFH